MLILIEKDSSTRIPKDVTLEQAESFAAEFAVHVVNEDGSTTPFSDWKAGQADTGSEDAAYAAAEQAAFEKSGLTKSKWGKLSKADRDALIQVEQAG
jgi:hypothetical protein